MRLTIHEYRRHARPVVDERLDGVTEIGGRGGPRLDHERAKLVRAHPMSQHVDTEGLEGVQHVEPRVLRVLNRQRVTDDRAIERRLPRIIGAGVDRREDPSRPRRRRRPDEPDGTRTLAEQLHINGAVRFRWLRRDAVRPDEQIVTTALDFLNEGESRNAA